LHQGFYATDYQNIYILYRINIIYIKYCLYLF